MKRNFFGNVNKTYLTERHARNKKLRLFQTAQLWPDMGGLPRSLTTRSQEEHDNRGILDHDNDMHVEPAH